MYRSSRGRVYTWKHRQPSSVIGDPNRVTRQACILARILESYIRQVEHLDLFVRSVHTCRLRETEEETQEKRKMEGRKKKRNKSDPKYQEEKKRCSMMYFPSTHYRNGRCSTLLEEDRQTGRAGNKKTVDPNAGEPIRSSRVHANTSEGTWKTSHCPSPGEKITESDKGKGKTDMGS